jgi:hypothetical protein|tara:strand:- start:4066 stop:4347 length:282 start_codon:yes stop_codon:yes gene_type:complete
MDILALADLAGTGLAIVTFGYWNYSLQKQIDALKTENIALNSEIKALHDASKEELKELLPIITQANATLKEVSTEVFKTIIDDLEEIKRYVKK